MVQRLLALAGTGISLVRRFIPAGSNRWFTRVLYATIASLGLLLATWENGDKFVDRIRLKFRRPQTDFDFIVVGSGSAGAIVANRLSENPAWKVLMLEVGGEPSPLHAIPGFALFLTNHKATDWRHLTVPQKNCGGIAPNNQFLFSQGRSLGGTANLNFMIHLRGSPEDFNNWANTTGDQSWNYKNLLPYFRKSEDYRGEWKNSETHGTGGPIRIEVPSYHPLSDDYVNAGQELGYAKADLNGYYTEGFDAIHYPTKNGRRHAAYRSFIRPARRRKNLSIYKFSHVNRILINENNEAYGVEYDRHGRKYQAFASKEVILSAGAIQSPKVLMLSGVGPAEHLQQLGIPVKVNLPVGNNLQDHVATYLGPFIIEPPKTTLVDRDINLGAFFRFLTRGQGPLTSASPQATGIFSSKWAKNRGEARWPDLQSIFVPLAVHKAFPKNFAKTFGLREDLLSEYYNPSVGKDSFFFVVSVGRPTSTGTIRLSSLDPYASLLIDPNYYDTPEDVSRMVEAMKFNVKMAEQTYAFKKLKAEFATTRFPGCEQHPYRSDEYWECYARIFAVSLHHIIGTCRMGNIADPTSVVDTKLRVLGIRNLRVIDASIMPVIPVSNSQAATFMIGERGAALIKERWTDPGEGYGAPPVVQTSSVYGPPASQYLPSADVSKTAARREILPADLLRSYYNMSSDILKVPNAKSQDAPEKPMQPATTEGNDFGFRSALSSVRPQDTLDVTANKAAMTRLPLQEKPGNAQRTMSGTSEALKSSGSMQNQVEKLFAVINQFEDLNPDADDFLKVNSELSELNNLDPDEESGGILEDFDIKRTNQPQGGSRPQPELPATRNQDRPVLDEENAFVTDESKLSDVDSRDPLGFDEFISDIKKINDQLTNVNEKSEQLAMEEAEQELQDIQTIPRNMSVTNQTLETSATNRSAQRPESIEKDTDLTHLREDIQQLELDLNQQVHEHVEEVQKVNQELTELKKKGSRRSLALLNEKLTPEQTEVFQADDTNRASYSNVKEDEVSEENKGNLAKPAHAPFMASDLSQSRNNNFDILPANLVSHTSEVVFIPDPNFDIKKIPKQKESTRPPVTLFNSEPEVRMEFSTSYSVRSFTPNNFLTAPEAGAVRQSSSFSNQAESFNPSETKYPDNLHVVDGSSQHLAFQ